jgi:hypothetical protein
MRGFITAERKKFLTGRDMTISVVSEVLSIVDLLPIELYERLGPARRSRNNWIHALSPVSANESAQSLALAFDLLRFLYCIDLDPTPEVMLGSSV